MGRVAGDTGRFNKYRKKKLAKRVTMRALMKTWRENAAAAATAKSPRAS